MDNLMDVILTVDGPVYTAPISRALGELPAVDLALAYGWRPEGGDDQIPIAAVTLQPGRELSDRDIVAAVASLPQDQRPELIHVVPELPLTTWYRPMAGPLRERGIPDPADQDVQAWYLDRHAGVYRPLTEAAHARLASVAS
jgi:putative long chain acyl-CoA synthase